MSIVLKVSTERINASASTVEGELSKVRASFDDLDGIMNRMSSYWEGEGANHYRSVYTKYKDDMLDQRSEADGRSIRNGREANISGWNKSAK